MVNRLTPSRSSRELLLALCKRVWGIEYLNQQAEHFIEYKASTFPLLSKWLSDLFRKEERNPWHNEEQCCLHVLSQ